MMGLGYSQAAERACDVYVARRRRFEASLKATSHDAHGGNRSSGSEASAVTAVSVRERSRQRHRPKRISVTSAGSGPSPPLQRQGRRQGVRPVGRTRSNGTRGRSSGGSNATSPFSPLTPGSGSSSRVLSNSPSLDDGGGSGYVVGHGRHSQDLWRVPSQDVSEGHATASTFKPSNTNTNTNSTTNTSTKTNTSSSSSSSNNSHGKNKMDSVPNKDGPASVSTTPATSPSSPRRFRRRSSTIYPVSDVSAAASNASSPSMLLDTASLGTAEQVREGSISAQDTVLPGSASTERDGSPQPQSQFYHVANRQRRRTWSQGVTVANHSSPNDHQHYHHSHQSHTQSQHFHLHHHHYHFDHFASASTSLFSTATSTAATAATAATATATSAQGGAGFSTVTAPASPSPTPAATTTVPVRLRARRPSRRASQPTPLSLIPEH
ncbi:hypothetical protein PTSG_02194 [Salpingoeca rosetta]|uniref:Uncharacterized protein n=1 Tax=Salpingoeca rosetta (strain ATCC 50818 / BSB-021) TaxID=946362 RepID=F2U1H4_SALR5|nr:uncharacterized protein PTSG_02194 [Salpingoeca rosetta]EGD81476.1 hypothetical protein PTSG_02194 [Salpingoeca rosetta]|eukprot:XP_004996680.1 hypothetical protein PTSG_02194 [Salpingoeca rosetta]